ncbi:MAG: hypothetical protein Q9195_006009 [Heterodermia aff. obscurata]
MSAPKRTVLITGCSDGGLGAALAIAFHEAGLHVYATARTPSKMSHLASLGIETLTLDVLSDSSIKTCVSKLSSLDILVNNAGASFLTPIVDLSIPEAKKNFDLNVWSYIAVIQAFMPLLIKSKGIVVNQTSVAGCTTMPFLSVYSASKAAMIMFSDTLRLEMEPFGVKVVDLRTSMVKSNIIQNTREATNPTLPKGSIFEPAKEEVERALRQEQLEEGGMPAEEWAKQIVKNLNVKGKPKPVIWGGESAWLAWFGTLMPFGTMDNFIKKLTGIDVVTKALGSG